MDTSRAGARGIVRTVDARGANVAVVQRVEPSCGDIKLQRVGHLELCFDFDALSGLHAGIGQLEARAKEQVRLEVLDLLVEDRDVRGEPIPTTLQAELDDRRFFRLRVASAVTRVPRIDRAAER